MQQIIVAWLDFQRAPQRFIGLIERARQLLDMRQMAERMDTVWIVFDGNAGLGQCLIQLAVARAQITQCNPKPGVAGVQIDRAALRDPRGRQITRLHEQVRQMDEAMRFRGSRSAASLAAAIASLKRFCR